MATLFMVRVEAADGAFTLGFGQITEALIRFIVLKAAGVPNVSIIDGDGHIVAATS